MIKTKMSKRKCQHKEWSAWNSVTMRYGFWVQGVRKCEKCFEWFKDNKTVNLKDVEAIAQKIEDKHQRVELEETGSMYKRIESRMEKYVKTLERIK